jgi:glutaminyl-peptide cyclotransferase
MRPVPLRRVLTVLVLAALVLGCGGGSSSARPAAEAGAAKPGDRFDGARAFAFLERQVQLGPRPAGSAASRRLARLIRARLPRGRFESVPGHPGLRNVVGRLPGRRPAILLAAHYDTKDTPEGFVGAEDGAGGTAAVLEIARALGGERPPAKAREVRFALFDGEECPGADDSDFLECGVRGSRAYADAHARDLGAMVLLDFIAQKDLSIPRDASSDVRLWAKLRAAARAVGSLRAFPDIEQGAVQDDHTPFLQAGVPAIDLIDFDFACWHQLCDDLSAVSERSLDRSGEAVLELMRRLRASR